MERKASAKADFRKKLSNLRAQMELGINKNILLINGLASYVTVNPNIEKKEFDGYAAALMGQRSHIINFGMAPDLIIKFLYPLKGNEQAIGLDYRKAPAQYDSAMRAKNTKEIILAGPIRLIQGGKAFIAEKAVFVDNNGKPKFWGLVSAPISMDLLWKDSGVLDFEKTCKLRIKGVDGLGNTGKYFWGSEFKSTETIQQSVILPNGSWILEADPLKPWLEMIPSNPYIWVLSYFMFFIFSWFHNINQKNISLKNEVEKRLYKSEKSFRMMFENSPVGIALCNSDKVHMQTNKAYEEIVGLSKLDLKTLSLQNLFLENTLVAAQDSTKESIEFTNFEYQCPNGMNRHINIAFQKEIWDKSENVTWVFLEDITEEKLYEKNLYSEKEKALLALDKAMVAEKAKGTFLSTMSHELRTPINGLLVSAELLEQEKLNEEQNELVSIINTSGNFLLNIINDILDYSKLEEGKMIIEKIPVSLSELINNSKPGLELLAQKKGVSFEIFLSNELENKVVLTDPTRFSQLIANLGSNAIKFTEQGSVNINISVIDNQLNLEVKDTGLGIEKEKLDILFQPFSQADASISRTYGGTGLGLSICNSICKLFKGSLEVESEYHSGSKFTAKIPYEWVDSKISKINKNKSIRDYQKRILLVDDNIINLKVGSKLLSKMGLDIVTANNGKVASELCDDSFDLVLMDIQMPVMDGIASLHEIRAKKFTMPILALTANVIAEDVERYLKEGFDDVAVKPIKREEIIKKLDTFFL